MKKILTGMLALLAGAYVVQAQGTVSLGNYLQLNNYIYVSYKPAAGAAMLIAGSPVLLGGSNTGPPPTLQNYAAETGNGNDWTVQLYGAPGYNDPQSSMVPLNNTLSGPGASIPASSTFANSTGGGNGDYLPGTWRTQMYGTISGTTGAGSQASVQLAAWYNDGGFITSYAQALALGVPAGRSAIVNTTTGGPDQILHGAVDPPTQLPCIPNFTVDEVPEPGAIALGLIGASAFLMRLREGSAREEAAKKAKPTV